MSAKIWGGNDPEGRSRPGLFPCQGWDMPAEAGHGASLGFPRRLLLFLFPEEIDQPADRIGLLFLRG
ncbi:MAG: hypothetical protein ABIP55_06265, partial [Tepidisphaeraceae bacterium]